MSLLTDLTQAGDVVKEAGQTVRSVISDLFAWIPNRRDEEATKQKQAEAEVKIAEAMNGLERYKIEVESKFRDIEFQLRTTIATTTAGQFIIYGFGGVTICQLIFNGLIAPFTGLSALPIAPEQWWLLFGVMGLEKLIDLKTRGTKQEGLK
jgi:hypothetical protein